MNNEPIAWINKDEKEGWLNWDKNTNMPINIPLYTQDQLEEARKLGMQQERALWELAASTQEIMDTHPVKELNDGGEPVKNATYWKRQYNLMATQNDNLKSGLYHANEQIKYLESHPVKELHLSLQKDKETGELLAVTYTDDEHRIVEVLWQRPPVKELTDEDLDKLIKDVEQDGYMEMYIVGLIDGFNRARALLRKASEK